MAEQCFKKSQDFSSLFLFYSSYGDEAGLQYLLEEASKAGKYNVAYEAAYLLGQPEACVDILMKSKRYGEAAMFARSYCPTSVPLVMKEWTEMLKTTSLPFVPENVFEAQSSKVLISQAQEIYEK